MLLGYQGTVITNNTKTAYNKAEVMAMETIIYTVKKGDTLYRIAKRFNTTTGMIARYNGLVEPDLIYPDQILRIPVSELPCKKIKPRPPFVTHIVKKGDTLASVALMHGSSIERIAEMNGIDDPDSIAEGQVLMVPVLCENEYTVKDGDTLYSIAKKAGMTPEEAARKNNIEDADVIIAGQGLRLDAPDEKRLEYIVQSGDTLYKIARKYGVSVSYLVNLNRLTCPDELTPGQVIIIRR